LINIFNIAKQYANLYKLYAIAKIIKRDMAKRCIYCKTDLSEDLVMDFCQRCGEGVWGPKMFQAIKQGMENARETGNLNQGSITDSAHLKPRI